MLEEVVEFGKNLIDFWTETLLYMMWLVRSFITWKESHLFAVEPILKTKRQKEEKDTQPRTRKKVSERKEKEEKEEEVLQLFDQMEYLGRFNNLLNESGKITNKSDS